MKIKQWIAGITAFVLVFTLATFTAPKKAQALTTEVTIELVTTGSSGVGGNYNSWSPSMSADGTKIAFISSANDLIAGMTTTGLSNVFLYDVASSTMTLVTAGSSGTGGNYYSLLTSISADGTKIVFESSATDLITGMTTTGGFGSSNIFLYDVATATTTLVTTGGSGIGGNGDATQPSITPDGFKIVFVSYATDLIAGMTTTNSRNIYLYDVPTATTTLVTAGPSGIGINDRSSEPSINSDGSRIAFTSNATDLVAGIPDPFIDNVFFYDVASATTTLVSKGSSGVRGNSDSSYALFSADGTKIVFLSYATDLISGMTTTRGNAFLYDVASDTTTLITKGVSGFGGSESASVSWLSPDASKLLINSPATDLFADITSNGQSNIYLYDVASDTATLITLGSSGIGGNDYSFGLSVSADVGRIAIISEATDLIPGMTTIGGLTRGQVFLATLTFYAIVTFDPANAGSTTTEKVLQGAMVNKPADPIKEGFVFSGWFTSAGVKWDFDDPVDDDMTLTAHWAEVFTITLDLQNGEGPITIEAIEGQPIAPPTDPIKEGFVFDGWFTSGGLKWDFSKPVEDDMTLTAHWAELITITLDLQNGEDSMTIEAVEGRPIVKPADPVKEGFIFDGWFTSDGIRWDFDDPIIEGLTLVAHWVADEEPVVPEEPEEPEIPQTGDILLLMSMAFMVLAGCAIGSVALLRRRRTNRL